jgi:hypothetical protein
MEGEHMLNNRFLILACAAAIVGVVAVPNGNAGQSGSHETFISFSTPFALPGVSLPAGTYIFDIANTPGIVTVVRVSSVDGRRVYLTAMTQLVSRPSGRLKDQQITFNEVNTGMVPQVRAWYPLGDSNGREFIYPKPRPSLATR